ncbi:hypothetical protein JXB28_06470 [Candidatus Woesearchaeota archaeon]|nr:hypothetical protein [Candidatus Woesearchaeota archaeon]
MAENQVLGQRTRKVNIDYGLAERLNKEVAEEIRRAELERLRNGKKTSEEPVKDEPRVSDIGSGFITLENIACVDASGKVIEKYDRLYVAVDVARKPSAEQEPGEATHVSLTPYQAIAYFEQQNNGLFLPSFALSCNILAALFSGAVKKEKDGNYATLDTNLKQVLDQYLDHGAGLGWHAQNTVVNWKSKEVIHYPKDTDFLTYGGNSNINKNIPSKRLIFKPDKFGDMGLAKALKRNEFKKYLINLTGLTNPEVSTDIGKYYTSVAKKNREAFIWVPNNPAKADYTTAAWLGCYDGDFLLDTGNGLDNGSAARGVRYSPEGTAQKEGDDQ